MQENGFKTIVLERVIKDPILSQEELSDYKVVLLKQLHLLKKNSWDNMAILIFTDLFMECIKQSAAEKDVNVFIQHAYLVGSKTYGKMLEGSQLTSKEKVILMIDQLGGFLDDQGDLQMKKTAYYKFDPQMPPGADFLDRYAKLVQQAFPNGLVIENKDRKLSKTAIKKKYPAETKIHQFRSQLDKHNIEFIQRYKAEHSLKNDEQGIKLLFGEKWFYADPQYHNRAHLTVDVNAGDLQKTRRTLTNKGLVKKIRKRGFYRKILSADYHSEFILDEKGQLLSQWTKNNQRHDYRELTVANGESFNYGERPKNDPSKTHDTLDGTPPRYFDTNERNQIKKNWVSPTDNWFYQLLRRLSEFGFRYSK